MQDTLHLFEFIVDPSLLLPHLQKPHPDPSATDLLIKFLCDLQTTIWQKIQFGSGPQSPLRVRDKAILIQAVRIFAYLNWDLRTIHTKLSFLLQMRLIEDLAYVTTKKMLCLTKQVLRVDVQTATNEEVFAAVMWHRWIITGLVHRGLQTKSGLHQIITQDLALDESLYENFNDYLFATHADSIAFLNELIASKRTINYLKFDSFVPLNEMIPYDQHRHRFDETDPVPVHALHAQLHFDLGAFYFFAKNYEASLGHFRSARDCFNELRDSTRFVYFDETELIGYLIALGDDVNRARDKLIRRFYQSIKDGYLGTVQLLNQDVCEREIPRVHRDLVALDVNRIALNASGSQYIARDLTLQIFVSNLLRGVVEGKSIYLLSTVHFMRTNEEKFTNFLIATIQSAYVNLDVESRANLKQFLVDLCPFSQMLVDKLKTSRVAVDFNELTEFDELIRDKIGAVSDQIDVDFEKNEMVTATMGDTKAYFNIGFEQKSLQSRIASTYNLDEIYHLTVEWLTKFPKKSILRINTRWELPIPIHSVVMLIDDPQLQLFTYIVLAKGRELMQSKNYTKSREMFEQFATPALINNTSQTLAKLAKLAAWELLLVQAMDYTHSVEWPYTSMTQMELQRFVDECKECLSSTNHDRGVLPRTEIVDQLSLFLLNVGEWGFLAKLDKRWNYSPLTTAAAQACLEILTLPTNDAAIKTIWELVLNTFNHAQSRDKSKQTTHALSMLTQLRNPDVLSLFVSLLARFFNILNDDAAFELIASGVAVWPPSVANTVAYDAKAVLEALWQLLQTALKYYPQNVEWLRLCGDINYFNHYYEAALKSYIESLIAVSDYFDKPLHGDLVVKRMIKCFSEIKCYTQAAVLCQFLDTVDYTTAFHCLNEIKPGNCYDAMDSYYDCIWDITILEYIINLHHKRGEEHRKRSAIQIISHLELNSNNSDEIKREVSESRKRKFMRAIAAQYVIKHPI